MTIRNILVISVHGPSLYVRRYQKCKDDPRPERVKVMTLIYLNFLNHKFNGSDFLHTVAFLIVPVALIWMKILPGLSFFVKNYFDESYPVKTYLLYFYSIFSMFFLPYQCRMRAERVKKNHMLNNLVEVYLSQHPGLYAQVKKPASLTLDQP